MADLTPTKDMADNAAKALRLYNEHNSDAGTDKGHTMASKIKDQHALNVQEIKDMYSFFARHEVDKDGDNFGNDDNPSNGYVSWLLWGGDAGQDWSTARREELKEAGEYSE
jgi:hypothetical protein